MTPSLPWCPINLFVASVPFPSLLKTSENRTGLEKGCIGNEWVIRHWLRKTMTQIKDLDSWFSTAYVVFNCKKEKCQKILSSVYFFS